MHLKRRKIKNLVEYYIRLRNTRKEQACHGINKKEYAEKAGVSRNNKKEYEEKQACHGTNKAAP